MHVTGGFVTGRGSAFIDGCSEKRALVETGDVISDETRGAEAMIEDFHLDLAAVSVPARESSMPSSAARLKLFGLWERRMLGMSRRTSGSTPPAFVVFGRGSALALIVHTDEIELRALKVSCEFSWRRSFMPACE